MQIGNPRKAMGCYRKAVEISPGHHKAAMNCGALALAAGNLEAAEAMLTAAERVVPQDPSIQFNFARLDLRLGRTDRARQRLEVARSDPSLVPMIDQILQQLSARPAPQTSSRPAG